MATTQKVTVTLQVEQVGTIRELVTAGKAESVSGFVQHAVGLALDDRRLGGHAPGGSGADRGPDDAGGAGLG